MLIKKVYILVNIVTINNLVGGRYLTQNGPDNVKSRSIYELRD